MCLFSSSNAIPKIFYLSDGTHLVVYNRAWLRLGMVYGRCDWYMEGVGLRRKALLL